MILGLVVKLAKKLSHKLAYKLGNISLEILSGTIVVGVEIQKHKQWLNFNLGLALTQF